MEESIEALNARIARLAMALGVSLQDGQDMAQVMSHHADPAQPQERRNTPERREAYRVESSVDRRISRSWEELRGLLVLRYDVQKHYVEQVGVAATRKILTDAEASLERKGFKPGDDGIDLNHLFDDR